MGAYAGQALLQVQGVRGKWGGKGPVTKVRSSGQTRSFWPVAIGEYKKRALLYLFMLYIYLSTHA